MKSATSEKDEARSPLAGRTVRRSLRTVDPRHRVKHERKAHEHYEPETVGDQFAAERTDDDA